MSSHIIQTSWGVFTAEFSERGLVKLTFPSHRNGCTIPKPAATATDPRVRQWEKQTAAALKAALAGRAPQSLPPLDWSAATPFQQQVWSQLRQISPGQVRTYAEIAQALGNAKASRAVGGACGANPIPVLVPCHRVVATGGKLGGFSGGLDRKVRLLDLEETSPKGSRGK